MSGSHASGASLIGAIAAANCVAYGYAAMSRPLIPCNRYTVFGPHRVPASLARSRTLKCIAERKANALPTSYRDLIRIYRAEKMRGNFDAVRNEDGSWSYRDLTLPPG